jgi:ADP-ribosylglycohydrolase
MLGAIAGDIIGSDYEWRPAESLGFGLFPKGAFFTDDTVMTLAVADVLLTGRGYAEAFLDWGRAYPDRGYGHRFHQWLRRGDLQPYESFGNGSAMRVSPVGWAFRSLRETLEEAERSALPTHGHPEGIKGARAVAGAVFMARTGATKEDIRGWASDAFGYDLARTVESIRPGYRFDETCQGSVPEALVAFLDSTGYESAVRNAVWLGGDADTQACIAGAVAEAFYGGVPGEIGKTALSFLDGRMATVFGEFGRRFRENLPAKEREKEE